jgi:hypothetical protein
LLSVPLPHCGRRGSRQVAAGSRDAPLNVAVHPDRELAYVSLPRANAIEEIDLLTGEAIRRIPAGIEPDGLRWAAHLVK